MTKNRAFDHLVLCVNDLDEAQRRYRKLGFTTTPVGVHPFGTKNSLVQLQGGFLEILAIDNPALVPEHGARNFSFAAFNRDFLQHHEGFAMVVFQGNDADGDAAEFAAKRLSDYAPFKFSRNAKLPGGEEVEVSFSLAFVTQEEMPKSAFFTCHQHAPQYFWKKEYQQHENSARAIAEVMMVTENPGQFVGFFEKLLNSPNQEVQDDGIYIAAGEGHFSLFTPQQWQHKFAGERALDVSQGPRLAGYKIIVDSLVKTTHCLDENSVDYSATTDAVFVPAQAAHGCVIEFSE